MKLLVLGLFFLAINSLRAEATKVKGTSRFEALETRANGKNYRFSISGAAANILYTELKIEAKYDNFSQDFFIKNSNLVVYTKFARRIVCSHIFDKITQTHTYNCWINVDESAELSPPLFLSVTKNLGEGNAWVIWSEHFGCYIFYMEGKSAHAFYHAMNNTNAEFDPDSTLLMGKTVKSYTKWGPQFGCNYHVFEDGSPSHFCCWTHVYTNGTIAHFK